MNARGQGTVIAALGYVEQGCAVVPVRPHSKRPRHKAWTALRISAADIPRYFHEGDNIGVLLGEASNGLVDVDLDCNEALKLADAFLPATSMVHGRRGKSASHRWYRASSPVGKTQKFCGPEGNTLVELRSTGGQTVVPPSIHESGESIVWESNGIPATVVFESLAQNVAKLAAGALLAQHWPAPGTRHDAALALAGLLLRSGWSATDATQFVEAVSRAAGDEEALQRARDVISTATVVAAGRKATAGKTLARIIGDNVVRKIRAWLSLSERAKARPADSVPDTDAGLVSAIRDVVLDRDTPSFDKRREVARIVEKGLLALGNFLRTNDCRAFFFHKGERRLYDVDQTPFRHLLTEISGLAPTESFFNFTLEKLQASANRTARLVEVHTFAHFDNQTGLLAVSDGATGVWARERGGDWQLRNNGDDDLLFLADSYAKSWVPDFSENGSALEWFLSQFMFANSPLAAEDYRTLMLIWLVQQFFPPLRRTRMIPAFLGPQGSGKTTAMRLLGRLLVGPEFDVTGLQSGREDAFVASVCNRVVLGLDNADSKIPFLPDALARYATGQRYQLRKLYTTNEEASFSPRAILMISSRDPQFNRPDVAERLLPLNFDRPKNYRTESDIFDELERQRAAIMGSLLIRAGEIADSLSEHPSQALRFRMADFASFGERVFARHHGSSNWIDLLVRLEKAQTEFASEGDGLVDSLRVLLTEDRVLNASIGDLFQRCRLVAESHGFIFPKSCQSFGRRLSSMRRVIEIELGVHFQESHGHRGRRTISLTPRSGDQGDVGDESEQKDTKEDIREPA
jgi:hypothetical protein